MVMGIDFENLLADPNFQQGLGQAGQAIAGGSSVAEALNPADLIRQIQTQKASEALLSRILGGTGKQEVSALEKPGEFEFEPTPLGQLGPDSVVTKRTADGTTTTVSEPSAKNLETFGSTVPAESIRGDATNRRVGSELPFFQTLLG
jgi:hypothetical protein